ncbi:hypothetical protein GGH94_002871, partial [Coemansia aciculifera]
MRHSESLDDALMTAPAALLRRTGSLLGKLGDLASVRGRKQRLGSKPLVITRVDHPWPHSAVDLPALDISEIIRRKDETFAPPPTPLSASGRTLTPSENRSSMTSGISETTATVEPPLVTVQLSLPGDVLRPSTAGEISYAGRPSTTGMR